MVPVGNDREHRRGGDSAPAPAMSASVMRRPPRRVRPLRQPRHMFPQALPRRSRATPAVRALAKQMGIALETVKGTGPHGRITADDVHAAAAAGTPTVRSRCLPTRTAPEATAPCPATGNAPAAPSWTAAQTPAHAPLALDRTAARFSFVAECDHRAVRAPRVHQGAHRGRWREAHAARADVPRAARGAEAVPAAQRPARRQEEEIVLKHEFHLGCATNTEERAHGADPSITPTA